jgi:hypothetical protein
MVDQWTKYTVYCLLISGYLLGFLFNPGDGCYTFLRNVGMLVTAWCYKPDLTLRLHCLFVRLTPAQLSNTHTHTHVRVNWTSFLHGTCDGWGGGCFPRWLIWDRAAPLHAAPPTHLVLHSPCAIIANLASNRSLFGWVIARTLHLMFKLKCIKYSMFKNLIHFWTLKVLYTHAW